MVMSCSGIRHVGSIRPVGVRNDYSPPSATKTSTTYTEGTVPRGIEELKAYAESVGVELKDDPDTPPGMGATVPLDDEWAWRPNTDAVPFLPGKPTFIDFCNHSVSTMDSNTSTTMDSDPTPFHPSMGTTWPPGTEADRFASAEETWAHHEWNDVEGTSREFDGAWGGMEHYGYAAYSCAPAPEFTPMPSKWGFRAQLRPRRTFTRRGRNEHKVFVGGLAGHTTSKTLEEYFKPYGSVLNASVLTDPQSCRSRGFGFVTFADQVPDGLLSMQHRIDDRLCGCRLYHQHQQLDARS